MAVLDHATGTAVSRYEYDATGNLLSSSLTTAPDGKYPPRLEVGWKGLFAERLDSPLTDSVVVSEDGTSSGYTGSGAAVLYDVRARVYRPTLGRFLQQDPLGTGVPVNETLRWHGRAPLIQPLNRFGWASHYRDGQHTMAFARIRSIGREDPTGLFIDILLPVGPTTTMDLWTNQAQNTLEWGNDIRGYVGDIFGDYAFNQEMDLDWAMDWSYGDNEYSRSTMESEYYDAGSFHQPVSIDNQREQCGTTGILRGGLGAAKNIGRRVYGSARGQLHHLLPKFLGGDGTAAAGLWALCESAHSELHILLDRRLLEELNICRQTGTVKIAELLESGAVDIQKVRRILIEVTKEIEAAYPSAAGMTKELMREIRRQGW